MPDTNQALFDVIAAKGIRVTLPKVRVLDVFQRASLRHLNADDVYQALQREGNVLYFKTIYRILGQFERVGLLRSCRFKHGPTLYELNDGPAHDHFVCVLCGRINEFSSLRIDFLKRRAANTRGFELRSSSFTLYGLCPACRGVYCSPGQGETCDEQLSSQKGSTDLTVG